MTRHTQKGTTLVELAIAIMIIGLLLAGTLGGINLLKASKLRRVATEFTNYKKAVDEFNEQYHYLPGDIPIASNYWTGAHNGDGDSFVEGEGGTGNLEHLYVWEHLTKSAIIPGTFPGALSGGKAYVVGVTSPASAAFDTLQYTFYTLSSVKIYNTIGDHFRLIMPNVLGDPWGGGLTGKETYSVDMKLDDGKASSGMFYGTRAGGGVTGCTDNDWSAASANYNLSSSVKSCWLMYWSKKY